MDIEIVFTGTRPGEKLFEELIQADEAVSRTPHEKIVQLVGTGPTQAQVRLHLEALERKLEQGDMEGLKAELYRIVGTKPAEHYDVDPEEVEAALDVAGSGYREAAVAGE